MKNRLFNVISIKKPKRNLFDLSNEKKISLNMGYLVPVLVNEIVPGDKFQVSTEVLVRMAPMIAPIMHRINVFIHYFFVPNRLVWDNWQEFITGGRLGLDASVFPKITIPKASAPSGVDWGSGTLPDYMGLPSMPYVQFANDLNISALPFRAYQLIYNEYYRDQNLEPPIDIKKTDTVSAAEKGHLITMRKRAWEKDYFTSALPWVQRGADVVLPGTPQYMDTSIVKKADGSIIGDTTLEVATSNGTLEQSPGSLDSRIENLEGYDITINDLRRATKLQEWLEKNARGGSRYIEQIISHFGVTSSDARLQRPQYLGGGKTPIVISEVLNTSDTSSRPQGSLAGHGISVGNTNKFKKEFEEHGYVIGLMSVLPRTAYHQGIPKHWQKFDKLDYYWPEFGHLGEQEIKNQEIYFDAEGVTNDGVFGYTPRYAEYKFGMDSVHGNFKDSLSFWHEGRIFSSLPALNSTFVKSDPSHRIFAVTSPDVHKIYAQLYHNIKAIRPMPIFGSPLL